MVNPYCIKTSGKGADMDIHARLREARKAKYRSAAGAAEAMGVSAPTYGHHENGTRGIPQDKVERYARFFGVSPAWLMFGGSDKNSDYSSTNVEQIDDVVEAPILGWVQAGVWQEPEDSEMDSDSLEFRRVTPHPRFPNSPHYLVEVRGDSFDKLLPDGSFATCIPFAETGLILPLNGQIIVAQESDQLSEGDSIPRWRVRRTLKRVRIDSENQVWLDPESTNPKHKPIKLEKHTVAFALVVGMSMNFEI